MQGRACECVLDHFARTYNGMSEPIDRAARFATSLPAILRIWMLGVLMGMTFEAGAYHVGAGDPLGKLWTAVFFAAGVSGWCVFLHDFWNDCQDAENRQR
jgi:hypothetical protein